jgi:hypothetical protein
MQRKQQVGECWVCVIFFACVCVWVRQIRQLRLMIPTPRALPLRWALPRGVPGGGRYAPPGYVHFGYAQVCPPLVSGFCYF